MPWSPQIPPAPVKPAVTGWWAVIVSNVATQLKKLQVSMGGDVPMIGTQGSSLKKLQAVMAGIEHPMGTVAAALKPLSASAAGEMPPVGVVDADVKPLAASLTGGQTQTGAIAAALVKPSALLGGAQAQSGVFGASLGKLSADVAGGQTQSGTIAAAMKQLSAAATGFEHPQGVIAASLKLSIAALAGGQTQTGTTAASLQKASALLNGAQLQEGTLAASLATALASLSGTTTATTVPVFDAVGAGNTAASGSPTSLSSTHVGTAKASCVVAVQWQTSTVSDRTATATFNGVPMQQLGSVKNNNGGSPGGLWLFGIVGAVTGGTDNIQVTFGPTNVQFAAMNSVSYKNVAAFTQQPAVASGSGAALSLTVPSSTDQLVVGAFGGTSGANRTIISYSQTERFNYNVASGSCELSFGDAAGASGSTTFTATTSTGALINWSACGVGLSGVPLGPSHDNSAISATQSGLASGTPFTWTQMVSVGSYGLIAVTNGGASTLAAAAVVKIGSATLTDLGSVYINNASGNGYIRVFGGPTIGGGVQTCSVQLTEAGKTFGGQALSTTIIDVASVGALQTAFGNSASPSVSVTSAAGRLVWGALAKTGALAGFASFNLYTRQAALAVPWGIAGDAPGASSVAVSGTIASNPWAAVGLDLTPLNASTPRVDAVYSTSAVANGPLTFSHTITGNCILVALDLSNGFGTPTQSGATCDGVAMTLLGSSTQPGAGDSNSLYLYGIKGLSPGTKSITLNFGGTSAYAVAAVSYKNVNTFGTVATNKSTGTGSSLTVASATNELAFVAFGANTTAGFTAFNKTLRVAKTDPSGGFGQAALNVGDAAGAATVGFTGTTAASVQWEAVGLSLS